MTTIEHTISIFEDIRQLLEGPENLDVALAIYRHYLVYFEMAQSAEASLTVPIPVVDGMVVHKLWDDLAELHLESERIIAAAAERDGFDGHLIHKAMEICQRFCRQKGVLPKSRGGLRERWWPDCLANDNQDLTREDRRIVWEADALVRRCFKGHHDRSATPEAIIYVGDRTYHVGLKTLVLEEKEDSVLQPFVEDAGEFARWISMDKPMLNDRSGYDDAPRTLMKLLKKYPILSFVIECPGKRGAGGFKVRVQEARTIQARTRETT